MAAGDLFNDNSDTESSDDDNQTNDRSVVYKQNLPKKPKSLCPNINISHITQHDYNNIVYEPSADTYLLMDCIENDGKLLNEIFKTKIDSSMITILEIGCGSGIVSTHTYNVIKTYCSQCIKQNNIKISLIGIDININALQITQNTMIKNGIKQNEITLIQSDLLNGIDIEHFYPKIDIMIFNPPYVPTTNEELNKSQNDKLLSAAWSGGQDGRVIIDKFIKQSNFYKLLNKHSFFYLVTIAMNKPDEIIDILKKEPYNLCAEIVAKKRVVQEMLVIIKFCPKQ